MPLMLDLKSTLRLHTWMLTTITAVVLLLLGLSLRQAHAQQSTFTDANGNYAGSAFRYPSSTTFTDSNGSFAGTAIPHGNSTSFYDRSGRYTGSATRQGTASNPLTGGKR
jgi:hypothetical protein